MWNLSDRPPSNSQNLEPSKENTSVNFNFKLESFTFKLDINMKENLLVKILSLLLGGSMIFGSFNGMNNKLAPAEIELNNNPISQEKLIEQSSN